MAKIDKLQNDLTVFQSLILFWASVRGILNIVNPLLYLSPYDSPIQKKQREIERVIYFHKLKIAESQYYKNHKGTNIGLLTNEQQWEN